MAAAAGVPGLLPVPPPPPPAEAPPKRVFVRDTREQDAADTAISKAMRMRNLLRDAALAAETAHNAQAFLKELETARKLQRECRKKLSALDARKKHLEVQEVLLADKDEQIRKRETRAKRLTDRAQRELKKLEKQKQHLIIYISINFYIVCSNEYMRSILFQFPLKKSL